jgi:hypothetical protein
MVVTSPLDSFAGFGDVSSATDATATVTFGQDVLIDSATAYTKQYDEYVRFGAYCNYTHSVRLDSSHGGLINTDGATPAAGSSFNRRINYNAAILGWGNASITLAAVDNTNITNSNVAPKPGTAVTTLPPTDASNARIKITTVANAQRRLLAGNYRDVLTIRLGTAFPAATPSS